MMMQKSVAIVTPQRSNSMDYLNFEERRQLIASSLSLSEILSGQGGGAPPAKESAAHNNNNDAGLGNTIVDERKSREFKFTCGLNLSSLCVRPCVVAWIGCCWPIGAESQSQVHGARLVSDVHLF